jgi:hypothetical protein
VHLLPVVTAQTYEGDGIHLREPEMKITQTKFILLAAGSFWLQFLLWIKTVNL